MLKKKYKYLNSIIIFQKKINTMYLTKMETTNKKIAVLSIINKINNNYEGFSITDCFDRVYLYKKDFIPQYFNDKIIFISAKSFQQNHIILSKLIRNYTINLIKSEKEILCIGGESYKYL